MELFESRRKNIKSQCCPYLCADRRISGKSFTDSSRLPYYLWQKQIRCGVRSQRFQSAAIYQRYRPFRQHEGRKCFTKLKKNTDHSISSLFSLLLFGIFVLFLMLMLLFFRKNLSADSKTDRLRFRTWNRYHLSDYQIPAAWPGGRNLFRDSGRYPCPMFPG